MDCFDIDKMAEKINYLIDNESIRLSMSEKTMLDKYKLQMENVINEEKTELSRLFFIAKYHFMMDGYVHCPSQTNTLILISISTLKTHIFC